MKKNQLITIAFCLASSFIFSQQLAFPGAQGFGKFAKGARASSSPTVYHVTNLNDTGTGSFRDAVSSSNRIVVFDVAGVIKITSRIVVSSNIYIAGQTAPGEGVTVYGNGFSYSGANNVICRYLRMRMGAIGDSGKDACGIANGSNMIFDHVSVSWGRDETFSISGADCNNITIQNSLIAQGLLSHSAGGLIQTDGGVTLYRNLYVDNDTRNNKIKGVNQYVNNIVYNWSSGAYLMGGDSEGQSYANCVSNYFVNGPAKAVNALSGANSNFHIYASDNYWDKNRNGLIDGYLVPQNEYSGGPDFQANPYNYPVLPTWPAQSLIDSVLPGVGASLPYRDLIDYLVVDELKSFGLKGEIITNETENSVGTPSQWNMWTGVKRTDTDNDGIPDAWESANGLNPNLASDAVSVASNGYLNIENFIHSLTQKDSQDFLRAPLCLVSDSATQNSVSISWFDFTEKETGYSIEAKINNVFTEIGRTTVNVNTYTVTGLNPEEKITLRVRAFNDGGYSTYSNELIAKAKPVPVAVLNLATYVPDISWSGFTNSTWDTSTANWRNSDADVAFSDSSKVFFGNSLVSSIALNSLVGIKDMVVNAENNYSISGVGAISGTGSVNKTGSGILALLSNNSYTGATVLYNGTLEIDKLANGGLSSSIGASKNYDFNLVLKGGKINYTGISTATDRNVKLEGNTEFSVSNNSTVLTMTGQLNGVGGLTKSGAGSLFMKGINSYEGQTVVSEGKLEFNGAEVITNAFSSDKSFKLNGGYLKTSSGSTTVYEEYYSNIFVEDGTVSSFEPYRNCYIYSKVSGSGTLNFNIPYLREYIKGDWSQFSGTVYANGTGSSGNQFMLDNNNGIPNARIVTSGDTKIICWKNASTMYLGGLSGPAGTYLCGADKQNNAASMTWVVGSAGTDETFSGIINNECSNASYKGTTSIVKEGAGYWKLTASNIYSGTTTIKGGVLIVNGNHTGTGKVTVLEDATLAGRGTIAAMVEVQSGATIQPGDLSLASINIGTLNVGLLNLKSGSQTNMEINRSLNISDKIISTSSINLSGTLNLTITGTLKAGDQFSLFSGPTVTGQFEKILPETPGSGLQWKMSAGVLSVEISNGITQTENLKTKFYPNPVVDNLVLQLDKHYNEIYISIVDMNGRTICEKKFFDQNNLTVDLSSVPGATYLVTVWADNTLKETMSILKK